MALNYAKGSPIDKQGNPIQEAPAPFVALNTRAAVTTISSLFQLNNNTTEIEVSAPNAAIAVKWISLANSVLGISSVTVLTADHIVPAATVRRFVVPRETQGIAGPALANSVHGLYQYIAAIPTTAAVSSVLVMEY